jgi:Zn-dependent M28 family amino/carboxypeptidase
MQSLVERLCSPECAGREAGTPGGRRAREALVEALRGAGLDPHEQVVPSCGGANVLASIPGEGAGWVLVAAHHDHLGRRGSDVYWGADDNAAAVAILVEVARALAASRPRGRGVILAGFDAEEPPYFSTGGMGSQHFVRHPTVPLGSIDMMVCMDLVGHRLGGDELPAEIGASLFALGAERSEGTAAEVERMARSEPGVVVRRVDAETIPPLSDYEPFWQAGIPFLFLTAGRSRVYHTPADTPDKLDWDKMAATARWLERLVRGACARDRIAATPGARDDASTLRSVIDLVQPLAEVSGQARMARDFAARLLADCAQDGRLPEGRHREVQMLVGMIESQLA